ncbi:MAG: cytochrome B5 [bacterium]|nr:cytochrome B5 [bacterium]
MLKTFTYAELQEYNGQNGKPVYICFKGNVYDVSGSDLWKTGRHQNRHDGGDDLTDFLNQAPHGETVFTRFPIVGKLE